MSTPRPPREEVLALIARVGISETARQLGMPKATVGRWAAAGRDGTRRDGETRRDETRDGTTAPTPTVLARASFHYDERLTASQQVAIMGLLEAKGSKEIMTAADCTWPELQSWQRDEVFIGVLADLRAERKRRTLEGLDAGSSEAVSTLRAAITGGQRENGTVPDQVAVRASAIVLDRTTPKTTQVEVTGAVGVLHVVVPALDGELSFEQRRELMRGATIRRIE